MIIYRYIIREQILPFLYTLSIIVFIFMMQLAVYLLPKILYKGLDISIIIELLLINMVWMIVQGVPMAVLVSTLMTFGKMSANFEIMAVKASGQNLFYLITPVFSAAMFLTVSLIFIHNLILPDANHRYANLLKDITRKKPAALIEPNILIRDFEHYAIIVDAVDHPTGILKGIKIFSNDPEKDPYTMVAENGIILLTQNGKYLQITLFDGVTHQINKKNRENRESYVVVSFKKNVIYIPNVDSRLQRTENVYRGDREKSAQALLADVRTFREMKNESIQKLNQSIADFIRPGVVFDSILNNKSNRSITTQQELDDFDTFTQWYNRLKVNKSAVMGKFTKQQKMVKESRQVMKQQDHKISQYLVEVHKKYSLSFACIVFVFIGMPLGVMARQGGMAVGASYSLFFFIIYWIFITGGERLADRLIISPVLAMWSCNAIIGTFGIILIIKMVREYTFINYRPVIKLWQKIAWTRKKNIYSKIKKESPLIIIFHIPKIILNKLIGILPSYLIRKFISNLIAVFGALIVIFVVFDYVSNLRMFVKAYFIDIIIYYWYYLAWFLQLIFPIGILLASMFSMTSLAIHNELIAIKAAGISIRRLTFALLFLGFGLSVFNFYLGEKIIPYANIKKKEVSDCMKSGKKYYQNDVITYRSRNVYRDFYYFGNKSTAYHFDEINISNKQARNVRRESFKSNKIIENIRAEYLIYTSDNNWFFVNGEKKTFQNGLFKSMEFDTLPDVILNVNPEEMVVPVKSIENMSYWELKDLLEKAKKRGENVSVFQADLHFKIALSFLSFIVMLLGLSVTARVGRKGGIASFGIGLVLVFSFWILSQLILVLGKNGTIDPVLAAWAGNILYFIIALFLYRRASR